MTTLKKKSVFCKNDWRHPIGKPRNLLRPSLVRRIFVGGGQRPSGSQPPVARRTGLLSAGNAFLFFLFSHFFLVFPEQRQPRPKLRSPLPSPGPSPSPSPIPSPCSGRFKVNPFTTVHVRVALPSMDSVSPIEGLQKEDAGFQCSPGSR